MNLRLSLAGRCAALVLFAGLLSLPGRAFALLIVDQPALLADAAPTPATACHIHHHTLRRGQTLSRVLAGWEVPGGEILHWSHRLPRGARARDLQAGDRIVACIGGLAAGHELRGLEIRTRRGHRAVLGSFPGATHHHAAVQSALFTPPAPARVDRHLRRMEFKLHDPLDVALRKYHLAPAEISAIHAWKHDDARLPSHLPTGTRAQLLLKRAPGSHQRLLRLRIWYHGQAHDLFSYTDASNRRWMLNRVGQGILHVPLETPVDYTRISSGWGWRENPVLHIPEFHKGIDFAAPMDTAVRAAASGVISFTGWRGNYGRLVILKNAPHAQTRYAHLSRVASNIHPGSRVHAGEVIGYVGSTGLSTGPHLYFELWLNGTRVDPLTSKVNLPVRLAGPVLRSFDNYARHIDELKAHSAG